MRAKRPSRSIKAMLRLLWLLGGASALAPSLPSCMTAKIESCDVTHLYDFDCDVTHLYDEPLVDGDEAEPCGPSTMPPGVDLYLEVLEANPLATKAATCFAISGLSDVIAQTCELSHRLGGVGDGPGFDLARTAAFAVVNGAYVAPLAHAWFGQLDTLARDEWSERPKWMVVAGQTALDQTLGAVFVLSTLHIVGSMADALAHGHAPPGLDAAIGAAGAALPATLAVNWRLWPLANAINFALVPAELRLLYINVVSVFWNVYLSGLMHGDF